MWHRRCAFSPPTRPATSPGTAWSSTAAGAPSSDPSLCQRLGSERLLGAEAFLGEAEERGDQLRVEALLRIDGGELAQHRRPQRHLHQLAERELLRDDD